MVNSSPVERVRACRSHHPEWLDLWDVHTVALRLGVVHSVRDLTKYVPGTNTDRAVYGAASVSASSFVVPHTQQMSVAAVAGHGANQHQHKQARD